MAAWVEVADRVYQARYQPHDVSVCVVRGQHGLLVVDTRSSHREADEIIADLAALGPHPVRWAVNTHAHFDHSFGNARFAPGSAVGVPIYGHELVPAHHDAYERPMLARWLADEEEPLEDWREVVITSPTELVGERTVLDLGDRVVELRHLGRGHTDNDLLVHVPDAATWLVGDLVEESGPPMYGSGSFPLDWPRTVGVLLDTIENGATLVPGHGAPVDAAFVAAQQTDLLAVAELLTELHGAGVPAERAVEAGGQRWPFPPEGLATAVVDGYRQRESGPT
jgi:glyoxylase-like metal-dependent hydrolase (beta-lactamase superfamily II)